jgi:hypothetical protein
MIVEQIAITAREGNETGMEILGDGLRPADRDCLRQMRIGTTYPGLLGTFNRAVKMGHLGQRMHAGIGASGASQAQGRSGDFRQGALQDILQRIAMRLRLPTLERSTVVFDAQRDSSHGVSFRVLRIQSVGFG